MAGGRDPQTMTVSDRTGTITVRTDCPYGIARFTMASTLVARLEGKQTPDQYGCNYQTVDCEELVWFHRRIPSGVLRPEQKEHCAET